MTSKELDALLLRMEQIHHEQQQLMNMITALIDLVLSRAGEELSDMTTPDGIWLEGWYNGEQPIVKDIMDIDDDDDEPTRPLPVTPHT